MDTYKKDTQYLRFCLYGFLKNLRFYDAFLLLFFLDNGISFTQIGVLYAVKEILTNVFEIPSGIIADLYGRKYSLLAAFFVSILAFAVFYVSDNFVLLFIGMSMMGISDAFRSGTHKGMIMDYLKRQNWEAHKVSYYGHTRSWSQIGSAISALLAGFIVFYSGNYRVVYLISIIPYLLNFVNIYTYPNALNYSDKNGREKISSIKKIATDLLGVFKKRKVLDLVNSSALHSAYLKSIKDYIQPLIIHIAVLIPIGITMDLKSKNGLVLGACYFVIFLMTSFASKNSSKVLKLRISQLESRTLLLGLFVGFVSGLLFYYKIWMPTLILFVLVFLIENLRKPILTAYLSDNVPNEILTSVFSIQSFYKTLMTAFISILLGLLSDYYGIGIALSIISLLLIAFTVLLGAVSSESKTAHT